ncbi:hypothetical protein H6F96_21105 [Microcoleus sp. FACHB-53]|jgi:hypothetical protein|nr:hypothetical protein [Microcoleus sp. FACHB-53]MBD2129371.1 hypothetical protein [Microcoleus sp. FACHB-1]
MFDFIKNLFGGIAAFFSGLFSGKKSKDGESAPKAPKAKKSKGYFLELDDSGSASSAPEAKKPEPMKAKAAAPAKQAESSSKSAVATLERPKTSTVNEVPSGNETVKIQAQPNPPAPATNGKVSPQAASTFAPNYLMPTPTNSRRRPGANMEMFRDMARQVKTPNR